MVDKNKIPNRAQTQNATKVQNGQHGKLIESNNSKKPKIVPVGGSGTGSGKKRSKVNEEYDLVPPDGGWGWLVLAGSMMVNILIPGTIKSFGVLFLEFLDAFNASPATAAWIPALCYFLYSSLGPVSSILSVKYSFRTVTIMGGASAAIGMIISFWATSVSFLYISYGVLVGIGAGLSFPPTVYIVTSYFVKLRGLANGLCISGSALGSIILPPLLRYLLVTYGYRGAVLIMGGVTLNVFVAAIFYEPVENHMIRVPRAKKSLDDIEEEDVGIVLKFESVAEENPELKALTEDQNEAKQSPDLYMGNGDDKHFGRSASAAVVQSFNKNPDEYNAHIRTRKVSTPTYGSVPQRNQTFTPGQMNSQNSLYAVPERGTSHNRLDRNLALRNSSRHRLSRHSPSTSSFQYISTPYHGSTLSFQPKEFSSHLSLKSLGSGGALHEDTVECEKEEPSTRSKFFDITLLKDPVYLIILISNSTNAIGYTNFIILLPAYGVALGFDRSLAAYLISIVSTTDLIGRIGGSALSDLNLIPKHFYYIGGLALSGVSLAVLPFVNSYGLVSFWCAVFGLASGVYVGITAVIMADMLGTDRLTSSYGISLFVNGILQLVGPPLCGLWFESARTYSPLFHTLGIILIAGASLWGLMPFVKKSTPEEIDDENDINQVNVEGGLLEEEA
ncbi:monocarboxylate transporter 9 [Eupeodes corollae]|uniref:monocarboxylate transporter 9 n=1 Tax=Eupeodes corollae TaxID=290404 RepID=UPI002490FB58|nr:monocarboxylate transporter 9 [Eupeodes corollae]